jgi:hypothetical protein
MMLCVLCHFSLSGSIAMHSAPKNRARYVDLLIRAQTQDLGALGLMALYRGCKLEMPLLIVIIFLCLSQALTAARIISSSFK